MNKLSRFSLFAVLLAFGLAACGDDVTIPDTPPTPLTVSLTPQSVTVAPGESVDLAVSISGGDPDASPSLSCTSSNTGVAEAEAVDTSACRVTGVSGGNVTVTASVTRGPDTASQAAAVTVQALVEQTASVSISSIRRMDQTVDLDNAFGQLDVTININRGDETPQRVDLIVAGPEGEDPVVVASQQFSSAEEMLADEDIAYEVGEDQTEQITLSFRSHRFDLDMEEGRGVPWHENGDKTIQANLIVEEEGEDEPRASNTIAIVFNNADTYTLVDQQLPDNDARDAAGRRWFGGPDSGPVAFHAFPVMYSGGEVESITVTLANDPNDDVLSCGTQEADPDELWLVEFECEDVESTDIHPFLLSSITTEGEDGPDASLEGQTPGTVALRFHSDHPNRFPVRIDKRAPRADLDINDDPLPIITIERQSGLFNRANWVNDEYSFLTGYLQDNVVEDGVGLAEGTDDDPFPEAHVIVREGEDVVAEGVTDASDLDQSSTNQRYNLQLRVEDRLGNASTFDQAASETEDDQNVVINPSTTFGVDRTPPVLIWEEIDGDDGELVTQNAAAGQFQLRGEDERSGFAPSASGEAIRHSLIGVLGEWAQEPLDIDVIEGDTDELEPVATPFETSGEGQPTVGLVGQTHQTIAQTAIISDGVAVPAGPSYYIYQAQVRDRAGNVSTFGENGTAGPERRAVYVNEGVSPTLDNLSVSSSYQGGASGTFAATAFDDVEVVDAGFMLGYQGGNVNLIWERPGSTLPSELRGPNVGEKFTDMITNPQNFEFEIEEFIRGIQMTTGAGEPDGGSFANAKPSMITGWVFNGLPDGDVNVQDAGDGISAPEQRTIPTQAVEDGEDFADWDADVAIDTWEAESALSDGVYTVTFRVTGPTETFDNPFPNGVAVFWTTAGGNTARIHSFADFHRTLDDGVERIFEWQATITQAEIWGATGATDWDVAGLGISAEWDGLLSPTVAGLEGDDD